jgi:predicted RNase H-like HicB family nuclease
MTLLANTIWENMTTFTAVLMKEEDMYIAKCPEVGTVSQGSTIEEAISNLKEATELYLKEFPAKEPTKPIITTFEVKVLGDIKKNIRKSLC